MRRRRAASGAGGGRRRREKGRPSRGGAGTPSGAKRAKKRSGAAKAVRKPAARGRADAASGRRKTGSSSPAKKPAARRKASPTTSSATGFAPGAVWKHLRIDAELGAGAYGTVFRATDLRLSRTVALKVMRTPRAGDEAAHDRFQEEARLLAKVSHQNVVTLYAVHPLASGGWALEMEHVEGETLEAFLEKGRRPSIERTREVVGGIAAALAAAHSKDVVHGDVKPGNVLLAADGTPKLADFGLARILDERERVEGGNPRSGTPPYMAPEAVMGEPIDAASDVWGVGVVLHRMLAGRLPFLGETDPETFFAILNEPTPPLGPEVPDDLAAIAERCLEKDPKARPAQGRAVLDALTGRTPAPPRAAARAAVDARGGAAARPVFGRDREVAEAVERLSLEAPPAEGAVCVVLTGPVGIGKTSVLGAVRARLESTGVRTVESTVSAVEGLWRPLHRVLRRALGDSQTRTRGRLAAASKSRTVDRREPSAANVERMLEQLSAHETVVVAVEDLHLASEEEARTLQRSMRRLSGAAVRWLVSERTPDLGPTAEQPMRSMPVLDVAGARETRLAGLADEAIFAMLEARPKPDTKSEGRRVSGAVAKHVAERSQGNPLFALQLFRQWKEDGAVVLEDGTWVPGPDLASAAPPKEVREVVARRLRALSGADRELLDTAAVDGLRFDGHAIAAVLGQTPLAVLRSLQRLARDAGLVVPHERGYQFAHPLIQEVIYQDVAHEFRAELHRRLAEHLETRGDSVDPERLGTHWERAGEKDQAAPYLLQAAEQAARRMENLRAVDLARRSGALEDRGLADAASRSPESLTSLANALSDLGMHEERERVHQAQLDAAGPDSSERRLSILARRALTRLLTKGLEPGDQEVLLTAAQRLSEPFELARARYALGIHEKFRGDFAESERWLAAAEQALGPTLDPSLLGSICDQRASVAVRVGRIREGIALYQRAARLCRQGGQPANAAISETNAILAEIGLGLTPDPVVSLERARRRLALESMPNQAESIRVGVAELQYADGRLAEAEQTLSQGAAALERLQFAAGLSSATRLRAEILIARGSLDEAGAVLAAARGPLVRPSTARSAVQWLVVETVHAALSGRAEQARACVASLVEKAVAVHDPVLRAESALALCEVLVWRPDAPIAADLARLCDVQAPGELEDLCALARDAVAAWVAPSSPAAAARLDGVAERLERRAEAFRRRRLLGSLTCEARARAASARGETEARAEWRRRGLALARACEHFWWTKHFDAP